jgi:hypothetical protein
VSDPILSGFTALFLEPTLGIPILLTIWALAAWYAWSPRPVERPPGLRRTWFAPASDLASAVYYSLVDGRYSAVLTVLYERLDEVAHRSLGLVISQLPSTRWGAQRAGLPDAPELRRIARGLRQVHAESVTREASFHIRWAFWRTPEDDEARYLRRVDRAVRDAVTWISKLEGTA